MLVRAEHSGREFIKVYLRRILALAVIGAVHYIYIWEGDILLSYAVGALALLIVLYGRARPILIGCAVLVGLGFIPDADLFFRVAGGLAAVGLLALYLRGTKRLAWRGVSLPIASFLMLLAGVLMSIVAIVFWLLPDGPIEPRVPLSGVAARCCSSPAWLSWRYPRAGGEADAPHGGERSTSSPASRSRAWAWSNSSRRTRWRCPRPRRRRPWPPRLTPPARHGKGPSATPAADKKKTRQDRVAEMRGRTEGKARGTGHPPCRRGQDLHHRQLPRCGRLSRAPFRREGRRRRRLRGDPGGHVPARRLVRSLRRDGGTQREPAAVLPQARALRPADRHRRRPARRLDRGVAHAGRSPRRLGHRARAPVARQPARRAWATSAWW